MLKNFLGLFLMTFAICIFILLMQFVWMHLTDLVGKGVEVSVLAEFFIYAVISVVPLALPLAILLASLMTFGNMGERFELTAMKSAGISLFRIMRSLTVTIALISVAAFFFSNYVMPISQVKLWTLIFSLRRKSPELDIPTGEFYDGIKGYTLYVRDKNPKNGTLYNLMIYDLSGGFKNATVMVADSGKLFIADDNKFLMLYLYHGESFENLSQQQQRATKTTERIPYRRETFTQKQILIDFSTEFSRYDESVLKDQHVSKDVAKLVHSIDSVHHLSISRANEQSRDMIGRHYLNREREPERQLPESDVMMSPDSVLQTMTLNQRRMAYNRAIDKAKQMRDQVEYNAIMLDEHQRYIRKHEVELHRKFTLSFACLIFFFIGAPLGAIIRKGGFGLPIIISVVMFIIYYIIDNTGYKMAREAIWPVWAGMWLSSAVLLPIGIFLTYKAATDSTLLNQEVWIKYYEKIKGIINSLFKRMKRRNLQ